VGLEQAGLGQGEFSLGKVRLGQFLCVYLYVYIFICVSSTYATHDTHVINLHQPSQLSIYVNMYTYKSYIYIHIHTYIYIYIYIYMYVYIYICIYIYIYIYVYIRV
jgi:hypothetical protein